MRMGFQFVKSPAIDGGDVPASRAERRRMTSPLLRTSAILAGAGLPPSLEKIRCPTKSQVEGQKARIDRKKRVPLILTPEIITARSRLAGGPTRRCSRRPKRRP